MDTKLITHDLFSRYTQSKKEGTVVFELFSICLSDPLSNGFAYSFQHGEIDTKLGKTLSFTFFNTPYVHMKHFMFCSIIYFGNGGNSAIILG